MNGPIDPALAAANLALTGKRRRQASRFASIELESIDRKADAWEAAAMIAVGTAALLAVLAAWTI